MIFISTISQTHDLSVTSEGDYPPKIKIDSLFFLIEILMQLFVATIS